LSLCWNNQGAILYTGIWPMDLNFPVFATGVRIFRASNDVGSWVHTNTRKKQYSNILVFVWTQDPTSLLALKICTPVANTGELRSIGQMPVILYTCCHKQEKYFIFVFYCWILNDTFYEECDVCFNNILI
jgi:hypothetical protein